MVNIKKRVSLSIMLKGYFTHMKLFFKTAEIKTVINITYIVRFSLQNRCFCVLILTVLMTKLSIQLVQPYYQIYYVYLC